MRRSASPLSLILLGIGVFLLALAPLLAWYVEPHAKRTPVDVDVTTVFTGQGSYFDTADLETKKDQKITITRRVLGDVDASVRAERENVAVWNVSTQIDTPKTIKLDDPRKSLLWTTERWVTDRRTNAPVHCCKESPKPFEGEAYLKFPFDVQERGYRWWDATFGDTVPLRYVDREKVQGYEGLHFTGVVKATRTGTRQVPGRLVGLPDQGQVLAEEWYANRRTDLVVDQRTGRIIKAGISPRLTLRAPGGKDDEVVLLEGDKLVFTEGTQRKQVTTAQADSDQLKLVGETAPAAGGAGGALLAAVGAFLVARGRRTDPQP